LASTALRAGKRVRTDTAISRGVVSHGQAALEVARRIFGGAKGREVLIVGAGEMATQVATSLSTLPEARVVIANRTVENAERLAAGLPWARRAPAAATPAALSTAHVAAFAGGEGALRREALEEAIRHRRDPLLVFDYGVPRCVDAAIAQVPGVFLYDLEALEAIVAKSLEDRRRAVPAAEALVREEIEEFRVWARTRRAAPAIRSLREWAEELRRSELERLPADASPQTRAAVDEATRRLVERLLRRPSARVARGMERGDPALPTPDHLRNVFGLGDDRDSSED